MTSKTNKWFRVLAEFLIIFAGVTLGLLADDWRKEREARSAERLSLLEMIEDLSSDSRQMKSVMRRMDRWGQATLWINRASPKASPDSILQRITTLSYYNALQLSSSTYIGLKDGRQLGLIRDNDLRRRIIDYYEIQQPYIKGLYDLVQEMHFESMDLINEYFVVRIPPDQLTYWPVGPIDFDRPWSQFKSDRRTRVLFEKKGLYAGNTGARLERAVRLNEELEQHITDYLVH